MVTDRISDFIIQLQNAAAIHRPTVSVPHSRNLTAIALKLRDLGFVASVETEGKEKAMLEIGLAYDEKGHSKIHGVKRISKPSRRLYTSHQDAHAVQNGFGARVISTSKGILSDAEARQLRVGGESLFEIW